MEDKILTIKDWLGAGSINIFGRPFAGKDTQGEILAKYFGGVLIGGGDILRSHHDPKEIEATMAAGGIIPTDFYLKMVLPYLSRAEFFGKPLILSSVGRSHGEEQTILEATNTAKHPTKAVISLELTEQDVHDRFAASQADHDRGTRSDDKEPVITNRLHEYEQKTAPVLAFYESQGLLIEVDGTLARDAVTEQIIEALYERATT